MHTRRRRNGVLLSGAVLAGVVVACGGKVPAHHRAAETAPIPTAAEMEAWLSHAIDPERARGREA